MHKLKPQMKELVVILNFTTSHTFCFKSVSVKKKKRRSNMNTVMEQATNCPTARLFFSFVRHKTIKSVNKRNKNDNIKNEM